MATKSVGRSLDMSAQMLDALSSGSSLGMYLEFEEVDLIKLLSKAVEDLQYYYGQKLVFESSEKTCKGIFASELLERIFENLISNAFKHGSKSKEVIVKVPKFQELCANFC